MESTHRKSRQYIEIIVVDNGDSFEDSKYLLSLAHDGSISCYIRNRHNMSFGYARNQAMRLSSGRFIAICDNDILYEDGWLERCIMFLDKNKNRGNYFATPLPADPMNNHKKRWGLEIDGWRMNTRAGSNCFVGRREDFQKVGHFSQHRIAGSKWADRYVRMGYMMAVMPEPMAKDEGLRAGYNFKLPLQNLVL